MELIGKVQSKGRHSMTISNPKIYIICTTQRAFYTGLWSLDELDDASTSQVLQDAAKNPDRYVLKPQREGGGNNLYGQQLKERLDNRDGLSAYILMQRIRPPVQRYRFLGSDERMTCSLVTQTKSACWRSKCTGALSVPCEATPILKVLMPCMLAMTEAHTSEKPSREGAQKSI